MSRRRLKCVRLAAVALGMGLLCGSLTCVQNVADTVGTGLTITGASGVLGVNSATATAVGAGLDLIADLMELAPVVGG